MGFQFAHMETYSRKPDAKGRSVGFVLQEAAREPAACLHVGQPGAPTVVHGVGPADVALLHEALVAKAGSTDKAGKRRAARVDQHTLLTVIASHPVTSGDVRADPAKADDVERWQSLVVAWLRERHGGDLVSVVRHDDESHPHLHAYVLPSSASMKARELHPGVVAKAEVRETAAAAGDDAKVANRKGDLAYKAAMRSWQDEYWRKVGLPCGQTRIGPGNRSLSKAAWQAEQAQVERVVMLEERAAVAAARIERARESVPGLRSELAGAKAARDAAVAEAAVARVEAVATAEAAKAAADLVVKDARREAAGIIGRAKREAARLVDEAVASARTMGATLGSVLYGLVGQSPSKVEARAAEAGRAAAAAREAALRATVEGVRGECRSLRRELADALGSIRRVAGERDELRAVVAARSMPAGASRLAPRAP